MHLLSLRSREFRVVVLLPFTQPVSTNIKRPLRLVFPLGRYVDKCNFKLQCSLRCCCISFHFSSLYCSSYFPPPTDLERNKSASMKAGGGRLFPFLPRTNTNVIFAAGIGGYSPPQILTSPSNDICCKEKGHGDRRRGRPLLRRRR